MAGVSFNFIPLVNYGVTVLRADKDSLQYGIDAAQLQEKAYTWKGKQQPRNIELEVLIATTAVYTDIHALLSIVRGMLNEEEPCRLDLTALADRYWMAHFRDMSGGLVSPSAWRGLLSFYCPDARAYDVVGTATSHTPITASPCTVVETTGGNATIEPVFLFSGATVATSLTIENVSSAEALVWTGALLITDTLEVDSTTWLVKKTSVASMATVTGKFPRLGPGANDIRVTGHGTNLGTLKITYRNRYI